MCLQIRGYLAKLICWEYQLWNEFIKSSKFFSCTELSVSLKPQVQFCMGFPATWSSYLNSLYPTQNLSLRLPYKQLICLIVSQMSSATWNNTFTSECDNWQLISFTEVTYTKPWLKSSFISNWQVHPFHMVWHISTDFNHCWLLSLITPFIALYYVYKQGT